MDGVLGTIMLFAGKYAPRKWAFCDGQLLSVTQNEALAKLLGNTYGGDGIRTFRLPDLCGRTPIGIGVSQNNRSLLSRRNLGEKGGEEDVKLTASQIASHKHPISGKVKVKVKIADAQGTTSSAKGNALAKTAKDKDTGATIEMYNDAPTYKKEFELEGVEVDSSGLSAEENVGGEKHNNMMPFIGMSYIICIQGEYPSEY